MIFYETIRNGKNVVVRLSHLLVFPTAIIQNIDSGEEKIEIRTLKRGECLIFAGDEHILTKIESAEHEKKIIEN